MKALEEAKKAGKARFLGVATHKNMVEVMQAAEEAKIYDVALTSFNFLDGASLHQNDTGTKTADAIAKATAAGLGVIAMKVQFGEIGMVTEWLAITGEVGKPSDEHPKKRVEGFSCRRSEVSGRRLWGLFRSRYPEPEWFFARFFVLNYCPLLFLDASGRNLTPHKLQPSERELLVAVCDRALRDSVECLSPGRVIGVGNFAAERAELVLSSLAIPVGKILHPSPSNPGANRNWAETAVRQLEEQGVEL
ncbi:MAG: single-stranded DNA-binding protein [Geobacter sp.]|nr:MAG: single-stranded DNA-binding protein [Geobacter sp.]